MAADVLTTTSPPMAEVRGKEASIQPEPQLSSPSTSSDLAQPEPQPETPKTLLESLDAARSENQRLLFERFQPRIEAAQQGVSAAQQHEARVYETLLAPVSANLLRVGAQPPPPQQQLLPQPLVPSQAIRPFMDVQAKNAVQGVVQTLGLMAQMAMAGRSPVAALSSLTGAMNGWYEGDRERANREWREYLANVDRIQRENESSMANWRMAAETWGMNETGAKTMFIVAEAEANRAARATAAARQNMADTLGDLQQQWNMGRQMYGDSLDLLKYQQQEEFKHLEKQRLAQQWNLEFQRRVDADHQRALDQSENRKSREQLAQFHRDSQLMIKDLVLGQAIVPGIMYYDHNLGDIRQATRLEVAEDVKAQREGGKANLTALPSQTFQALKRLTISPPILDRIDTLLDRITKEAPGENLTSGLIARLKKRAGISEDLQEFASLNTDSLIELGTALSGRSSPLISIVKLLRGETLSDVSMTTPVAKKANDTVRTTVNNRIIDFTQDPESPQKLSRMLLRYHDSPGQKPDRAPEGFTWK